jgi:hypothetical protein
MSHWIPKPYRKKPVTVRIDVDKLARIDRLLAQYGLNRSELINRCIDYGLDNLPEAILDQEEVDAPLG